MTARRLTLLLVLLIAGILAGCNLGGEPEQVETLVPTTTLTPTGSQQATLSGFPTGVAVTTLPILTPGIFPTSIAFIPPTALSVIPSVTPSTISIVILSPIPGNVVSNNVQVLGSAIHPNFVQYQLEYGPEPNPNNLWYTIGSPRQTTVLNGVLGIWSTNTIPDGTYQLRLRVYLRDGSNPQTVVNNIRVQNRPNAPTVVPTPTSSIPRPIAAFSVDRNTGEAPLVVRFTNRSTGQISGYGWNFGDGSSSAEASPVHVFRNAGEYEVKLTVVGPGGQSNVSQIITVNVNPPNAQFEQSTSGGPSPLTVQFTDRSTGQIDNYRWDFGDGTTSNERSPRHVFTEERTYNVTLRVRGPGGTGRAYSVVTVTRPQALPPAASFTPKETGGPAPLSIQFTDTSTGEITARLWEFGDGTTSTDQNPIHRFDNPGTYNVRLTVSGPGGTVYATGTVVAEPPAARAPVAAFTAEPTSGNAPLAVTLDNNSQNANSYRWDFGDGSPIDTSENPTHTYTQPGTYTVTLTATGANNLTHSAQVNISVAPRPVPPLSNFTAQPTEGSAPLDVTFTNLSSGDQITSTWDFGDGQTLQTNESNVSHRFEQNGTYTVTLRVTGQGDPSTSTKTITVTDRVQAAFRWGALTDPPGLGVGFQDQSTGEIASWAWNFGDGANSNEQNPTHTYNAAGTYTVRLRITGEDGVTSDAEQSVTVSEPLPDAPIANFTATVDALRVNFTDASTGQIDTYTWDFGDGTAGNERNPVHEYTNGGTYTVRLIVENEGGSSEVSQQITVAPPPPDIPESSFTFDATDLNVAFTDTSTGEIASWFWDFGDGTTSNEEDPTHAYQQGGTYRVRLTVGNAGGSDTSEQDVTVDAPLAIPVANFDFEVNDLDVQFTDTSSGQEINSWVWDFGDGATSNEQNPSHTYQTAGTYNVTLTVANESGPATVNKAVTVTAPVPNAPTSAFTFAAQDLTVQFTDMSTGEGISAWRWEFGDGSESTEQNPTHTYAAAGTYRARLTVTNPGGEDRSGQDVTVTAPPPTPPVSNFTFTVNNLDVSFTDASAGVVESRQWDFGDGTTSVEANPTHSYAEAGTFTVTLTVINAGGQNSSQQQVTVTAPLPNAPTANFDATPNNLDVQFTDTSTGEGITSWTWNFGDGGSSTEQNPAHSYQNAGTYDVTLTVANTGGQDSETKQVTVSLPIPDAPTAGFTFQANNLDVQFTDASSGQVDARQWDFGDGSTSTDANPTHSYAQAGTYNVTLTVANAGGQNATSQQVTVAAPLPSAPSSAFTFQANNLDVQFNDASSGQVDSYSWNFGDGATSDQRNPSHSYAVPGTYDVTLTVANAGGQNSSTQQVTVNVPLPTAPTSAFTFQANNLDVQFTDASSGQVDTYSWNFGDGTFSDQRNPAHSYPAPGTYNVELTVANAGGSNASTQQVSVSLPVPDAPTAAFTHTTNNLEAAFTNTSSGQIDSLLWDFGDGTTSTEQNPSHIYAAAGTYNVTLTVTNAGGANNTSQQVTVSTGLPDLPTADFTADATGLDVQFTDATSGQVDSWLWDFGDGSQSTEQNPLHTYAQAGTYTVSLSVTNAAGSSDAAQDVTVEGGEEPADSVADTTPVSPDINDLRNDLANIFNANSKTANVFAVVGDRSVAGDLFLAPFGDGQYELSESGAGVEEVIQFYLAGDTGDGTNPFDHVGETIVPDALASNFAFDGGTCGDTIVACELDAINPAITIISLGYRDARAGTNPEDFRAALRAIVDTVVSRGSIPLLLTPYTRPGEEDAMRQFAEVVIEVADANDVPVLNVWRMINEMPEGMSGNDLSVAGAGADRLGDNQISRFGENARNFYTLEVLDEILEAIGQ
jgi:PKD repeat protein